MYTGQVTGQQRAKTVVPVGKRINGTRYLVEITLICGETIYVKNYYDSTVDSTLLDLIDDAIEFLNSVYNADFFLYFEMDGLPQTYSGIGIDACPHGSSAQCSILGNGCDTLCKKHHKNINAIGTEALEKLWERNHVVVFWSDAPSTGIFCYDIPNSDDEPQSSSIHLGVGGDGVTAPHGHATEDHIAFWPVIQITKIGVLGNARMQKMSIILAHEIAHTLGLQEIYMDWYNDELSDHKILGETICIMAPFSTDTAGNILTADKPLCDYCTGKLLNIEIDDNVYELKEWER